MKRKHAHTIPTMSIPKPGVWVLSKENPEEETIDVTISQLRRKTVDECNVHFLYNGDGSLVAHLHYPNEQRYNATIVYPPIQDGPLSDKKMRLLVTPTELPLDQVETCLPPKKIVNHLKALYPNATVGEVVNIH